MNSKTTSSVIALIILLFVSPVFFMGKSERELKNSPMQEKINLFNGQDLSNWIFKLKDESVDPSTVFTVQNGLIHIKGDPFGYMRTKNMYSNYTLHIEWRWPSEATNSGIFVHGQHPDTIWIKCIECQLKAGSAGDFVCMNGTDMKERTDKTKISVAKIAETSEKNIGEWNTMEVVCQDNTITVYVNGVLQNKATEVTVNKGYICLQSEGKEIEFKNIYLTPLKI